MISKQTSWLRTSAILAFITLAIALTLSDWLQGGQITTHIQAVSWLGAAMLVTEACFIVGALLMAVSAGESLAGLKPQHWFSHLRYLRREVRTFAHRTLVNPLFGLGFGLNFSGAVGTSIILAIGVIQIVPRAGWGVLIIIFLDLAATFIWRVPLHIKRRSIIKQVKHENSSSHS